MPGRRNPLKWAGILLPYAVALAAASLVLRGHSVLVGVLLPVMLGLLYWLAVSRIRYRSLSLLLGISLLLRIVVIWGLPQLSDDFFRFLWDGSLWLQHQNAFVETPSVMARHLQGSPLQQLWLRNMNSSGYFSVYPPLHQMVFAGGAFFADKGGTLAGVQAMRIILILLEMLLIARLWKMNRQGYTAMRPELYALNPLVILEISGNLHFEGMMMLFLLLALGARRSFVRGGWLAAATAVKLLPLLALPALLWRAKTRSSLLMLAGMAVVSMALWAPFFPWAQPQGIAQSLVLYFNKFEFNASLFHVFNAAASWVAGYNFESFTGPLMALTAFLLILWVSILPRSSRPRRIAAAWWIYLLLATTVHPWYLIPLVIFGIYYLRRTALYWSVAVMWSYLFYLVPAHFWIAQLVEYGGLAVLLIFELRGPRPSGDDKRVSHF